MTSETSRGQFSPPSAVVEPACAELLLRLRRARSRPGADQASILGEAERAVFALSVEKRKSILESSLGIILAQWALYRFAFRSAPRPVRFMYGSGAFMFTTQYATARAAKVTSDMFTSILNLPDDSSLGNEARIILADLEGPDGPFYVSAVDETLRRSVYERAISTSRPADADDIHPQLLLGPRLMVDMGSEKQETGLNRSPPSLKNALPTQKLPNRTIVSTAKVDVEGEVANVDTFEAIEQLPPWPEQESMPDSGSSASSEDFLSAIRRVERRTRALSGEDGESDSLRGDQYDSGEAYDRSSGLSPSQRRAAERAARREHARMRSQSHIGRE